MQSLLGLLTKNKAITIGFIIIVIVILIAIFSGGKPQTGTEPSPLPSTTRLEIVDLNEQKRRQAAEYRATILAALPIYVENFKTSVGIDTTINIYALADDPPEVVRLEVYGLSYLNEESNPKKNPNVTAYQESYAEAIRLIRGKGIDPKKLIFIYGDKEYVRKTTLIWVAALKLSP